MLTSIAASLVDAEGALTPPAIISTMLALTGVMAASYRYGIHRERARSVTHRLSVDFARLRADMRSGFSAIERRMRLLEGAIAHVFDHQAH